MTDREFLESISWFYVVPPDKARAWWAQRHPGEPWDQMACELEAKQFLDQFLPRAPSSGAFGV